MKGSYPSVSLERFCRLLGVTRQAMYQHGWRTAEVNVESELIIQKVIDIRHRHPMIGTRKLYLMLQPFLAEHKIKIGRDKLFGLLSSYKLLIRIKKRNISTTQSYHRFRKYPNLIKEMKITAVNQLWVTDITYCKLKEKFAYLSFVTDAYSHKSYHVAETLHAVHSLRALQLALESLDCSRPFEMIHHSDRGIQYCSEEYVSLLEKNQIKISMTESGDPLENPIAERINGIIKNEYLHRYRCTTINELSNKLKQVVELYNAERPHMSCSMFTPAKTHNENLSVIRQWKTYYHPKIPAVVT